MGGIPSDSISTLAICIVYPAQSSLFPASDRQTQTMMRDVDIQTPPLQGFGRDNNTLPPCIPRRRGRSYFGCSGSCRSLASVFRSQGQKRNRRSDTESWFAEKVVWQRGEHAQVKMSVSYAGTSARHTFAYGRAATTEPRETGLGTSIHERLQTAALFRLTEPSSPLYPPPSNCVIPASELEAGFQPIALQPGGFSVSEAFSGVTGRDNEL